MGEGEGWGGRGLFKVVVRGKEGNAGGVWFRVVGGRERGEGEWWGGGLFKRVVGRRGECGVGEGLECCKREGEWEKGRGGVGGGYLRWL